MVLIDSGRVPRVPPYLGVYTRCQTAFAYGTLTPSGGAFQHLQLTVDCNLQDCYSSPMVNPATPMLQRL